MPTVSLSAAISASFINRFVGSALGSSSSSAQTSGSSASVTRLSNGLRYGAQVYGTAVQSLNATLSLSDLAQSSLEKLAKITDKLISLTEKAVDGGTGDASRRKLQVEFKKLATEFRDVVSSSKVGDIDYLDENGLETLFSNVGLSKEDSESLAAAFKEFILPDKDTGLASEKTKAKRPVDIPSSAFIGAKSPTTYNLQKTSENYVQNGKGGISTVNSVFPTTDNQLNQNPGVGSEYQLAVDGSLTAIEPGVLTTNVEVMSVNESTGYSVIKSTDDIMSGQNSSNYGQLFIVDASGNIVHQVTAINSADVSIVSADISKDNKTVAYILHDNNTAEEQVIVATAANLGDDPALSSISTLQSGPLDSKMVKISNSGEEVAYVTNSGGLTALNVISGEHTRNEFSYVLNAGFTSSDAITYVNDQNEIFNWNFFSTSPSVVETASTLASANTFSTLEYDSDFDPLSSWYSSGFYGYVSTDNVLHVTHFNGISGGDPTTAVTKDLGAGASVSASSMAYRSTGQVEVGLEGSIPAHSGDSGIELYRMAWNPLSASGRRISLSDSDPENVLDASIATKPDAYRTMADLKKLKEQIQHNIKAIDTVKKTISDNLGLVRQTGLSMLDLSYQVTSKSDAEQLADELQQAIRENTSGAYLAQAGNLTPIAAAAISLASGESSLTSS